MSESLHFAVLRQHFTGGKSKSGADMEQIHVIHKSFMLFSWVVLAGVGLWAHHFKHKKWAIPLHAFCMSLLTLLTVLAGLLAIIKFGLNSTNGFYVDLGLIIVTMVMIVATGGFSCYILRLQIGVKPIYVYAINKIHRYAGRILIIMSMFQLLASVIIHIHQFVLVIILNVIPFIIFYLLKFKQTKINNMHNISMNMNQLKNYQPIHYNNITIIKNNKDLNIYKDNYYIFADKIYSIQNIINNHPGGWQIINAIRGRQIDRYWYGMQTLQMFTNKQMIIKNHSNMAIKMAGNPIAVLFNHSPYQNMDQISVCTIQQVIKPINNNKMYVLYLALKENGFKYIGYSQLDQLGKYFAVNINSNLTRLYSVVNFLHGSNLQLMDKIIGKSISQNNKLIYYNNKLKEIKSSNQISSNLLPLFMKRYENGKFTKQFTSGNFIKQVKISKPRGRGLCLHQLQPGNTVLMFAGGTGLNVYCDLIDLLFKQTLIQQKNPFSNQLIAKNLILKQQSVGLFSYIIYIAVEQISQIHSLTLYQLNYLAQRNKMKVFVKSKDQGMGKIYQQNNSIIRQTHKFETVLDQQFSKNQNIVRVYLCGPPPFSHAIVSELSRLNIDPIKYKIL